MHRGAQVAVAAADLVELLLVDRRQLTGLDRGRGVQPLEADLVADAVHRQLAGRGAFEQDQRELAAQRGELVALAGGLAALLVDAAPSTPVAQAQQLVELIQQLVAALDHERVQQDQHERVAARGLQAPQLLGGHPAPERLERAAPRRRQRAHVDLRGAERDEPAVLRHLAEQLLDPGSRGAPAQLRDAAGLPVRSVEQRVE